MPTLPTPGGDLDTWGDELNEFLSVAHEADGRLFVTNPSPGLVPLIVYGAASQTADLVQIGEIPSFMPFDTTLARKMYVSGDFDPRTSPSARNALVLLEGRAIGTSLTYPGYPSDPSYGLVVSMSDHWNVVSQTITGAANNGSGLIRLTVTGHAFLTGDSVAVGNVVGTTEANGGWIVTKIDANHVDLQGSTFSNAYVSGGKISNRPFIYGAFIGIGPLVGRLDQPDLEGTAANGSDAVGVGVFNNGYGLATAAFNINRNSSGFPSTDMEWMGGYSVEANVIWPFRATGAIQNAGLSFEDATFVGGASQIVLKNDVPAISIENAAGSAYLEVFRLNALDKLVIGPAGVLSRIQLASSTDFLWSTNWDENVHLNFGTTSGSKIGQTSSHKFAFWGATPVAQQVLATGTGKTVDNVITLLQTLGLCRQS